MKYTDSNKPMQCFMAQSTCYKGTRTMNVLGVLWHSTGANNPWLKRYAYATKKTTTTTTTTTETKNTDTKTTTTDTTIKAGSAVKLATNATYYSGKAIPDWVKAKNWIVKSVKGDRAVIDKSVDGTSSICSPVNTKYLTVVNSSTTASAASTFTPYRVKVTADVLNIRKGAGTNYSTTGAIKDKGVYTIIAESNGTGANKWGRLKSGAGWISLDYTTKI